jgi:hypothetical protein
MEYDYSFNERNRFSVSVTPGFPMAVIFSFGWKHFLGEIRNEPKISIYVPRK